MSCSKYGIALKFILKVTNSDHINPSHITIAAVVRLWHMITILKKIYYVSVGLSEDLRAKSWSRKVLQISVQKSISACPVLLRICTIFWFLKTGAGWHTTTVWFVMLTTCVDLSNKCYSLVHIRRTILLSYNFLTAVSCRNIADEITDITKRHKSGVVW